MAYAKVLDAVSEGPIYGPLGGLSNLLQHVYLDGTPVQNADGSLNFQGVMADFRSGTQDQDYIAGFPASENVIGVDVELRSDQPFVRQIMNTQLSALRVTLQFDGLSKANTSNGDINGYRIEYAVDIQTDDGAFVTVLQAAADGKTTSSYARTHRIDLPKANSHWNVRIRRLTPNANSSTIADATRIQSMTEVVDVKLRHPMTALVGIQVDASQFQSVPQRAYHFKGRILAVPANYDPESGLYSGTWDGAFKQAYSNNPAWVFYDLVANERYGLGAFVPAAGLSMLKWALYPIARYCDERVPDGLGGQERRFSCNTYLQSQADAYRVLADLASIFRGMVYESSGAVMAAADIPADPSYTFSAANIIDGRVSYTGSPLRKRHTLAQVSWNDLSDMGRAKVEVVNDPEGQARLGIRPIELTAFGCTSRAQAVRAGKWALLTSQRETQAATWQVGLDQALVAPGKVVRLADPNRAGRRIGGRVRSATDTVLTVDVELGVRPGDRLVVNLPSGVSESRVISEAVGHFVTIDNTTYTVDSTALTADMVGMPGSTLSITVTQPFSESPAPEAIWSVESEQLSTQLMRVISVARKDGMTAEIAAVQHEPGKFAAVDYGTKLDPLPITVIPPSVQPAPSQLAWSSYSVINQGIAQHNAVISWKPADAAIAYQVQWRRDNSDWIEAGRNGSCELTLENIRAGSYVARVRAINAANIPSVWATSMETQLEGDLSAPPAFKVFTAKSLVFGIQLDWGFPEGAAVIEHTELRYAETPDFNDAILLGTFPYPQKSHTLMGLAAGRRLWFWARLVDKLGLPGPWYPNGQGVAGAASSDASEILGYLEGKIGRDEMAQGLLGEIDGLSGSVGALDARLTEEHIARVSEDGALSERIDTVIASTEEAAAAVQETKTAFADVDGKLKAEWRVQTQATVNGTKYVAGMAAGVYTTENGDVQSSCYFLADRFALLTPGKDGSEPDTVAVPFVVENGQTFINQAFIGQASITDAQIQSLNAAKITAGTMSADRIETNSLTAKLANVDTAYIKTANIGVGNVDRLRIAAGAVTGAVSSVNTNTASATSYDVWNDVMTIPLGITENTSGILGLRLDQSKRLGSDAVARYRILLNGNVLAVGDGNVKDTGVWYNVISGPNGTLAMSYNPLPAGSSLKVQISLATFPEGGGSNAAYTYARLSVDMITYYR
ncbi:host specificity protein J [Bordetella hinzii LMG 13501]|nr:host specificity protein J [Bordetella hinzii LMG 13501]